MNRPALLVVVRHGQSERNIAKKQNRFYLNDEARKSVKGIPDHRITLTDEGRRQASVTGTAIRESFGVFDYVIHSGYTRTAETTEAILAACSYDEMARRLVLGEAGRILEMTTLLSARGVERLPCRFASHDGDLAMT